MTDLKKIIEELYRNNQNPVGNGSTADALRYEKKTGVLLSPTGHAQKAEERRTNLIKVYNNLDSEEKLVADDIYNDLSDAIKFKP